jgi:hypothetical protein
MLSFPGTQQNLQELVDRCCKDFKRWLMSNTKTGLTVSSYGPRGRTYYLPTDGYAAEYTYAERRVRKCFGAKRTMSL